MSDPTNVTPIRPFAQPDGWSTESSDYSPDRFYVVSAENSGQRVSRNIWLPATTDAQIVRLIQEGKIRDYRSRDDIIRDALVHRLFYVNQLLKDGVLGSAMTGQMRQAKIDAVMRNNEQDERYVESSITGLQKASGNPSQLRVLIETLEGDIGDPSLSNADRVRLEAEVDHYRGTLRDE